MKFRLNFKRFLGALLIAFALFVFLAPDIAEAKRGGGRSGGRSFGGKRSYSTNKSTPRRSTAARAKPAVPANKRSSFGGSRLNSSKDYTSKYGVPRKTSTVQGRNAAGLSQNYQVHSYGGFSSGLMTGYMMGATSFWWSTPFHGAFYYSRPYYVNNPDGTIGVYPPTFSFGKMIMTLLIAAVVIWLIYRLVRKKKSRDSGSYSQSSFG